MQLMLTLLWQIYTSPKLIIMVQSIISIKLVSDSLADESKDIIKLQAQYARGALWYQLENYAEAVKDFEAFRDNPQFRVRFSDNDASLTEKLALSYSKTNKKHQALELVKSIN